VKNTAYYSSKRSINYCDYRKTAGIAKKIGLLPDRRSIDYCAHRIPLDSEENSLPREASIIDYRYRPVGEEDCSLTGE